MTRDGSAVLAAPTGEMPSLARALASAHPAHPAHPAHDGTAPASPASPASPTFPTFDDVYAAHVGFVWRVLRTFGVSETQIEDAVQDVFIVVHRRLPEWQGRAAITTWLFAIARRVASSHRRRSSRRTEGLTENLSEELVDDRAAGDPFGEMSRAQAAATVLAILEKLDEDKRVVFALVELEQLSVPEVARMLDLNLNTAYSRLRLARQAFEAAVKAKVAP